MRGPLSGTPSEADASTPPFPSKGLGLLHSRGRSFSSWRVCSPSPQSFYCPPLISSVRPTPGTGIPRSGPLNSFFLSTGCFIDSRKCRMTSSLRGCKMHHQLYPVLTFTRPSSHRCVPTVPCVVEPDFVLPSLDIVGIPRNSPRITTSLRCSRSPNQHGTKSQHNRDISLVHCPRHRCPNFIRNFLRQQRRTHLPPTGPHEPRCSDFVGHPRFVLAFCEV